MHQRLIRAAAQFASCNHPDASVGTLVLYTSGDTLDAPKQEPTGDAWCARCGSIRVGGSWRATLFRFEIAVAAGAATAEDEALTATLEEARVCARELGRVLRETASAPVTAGSSDTLEALARSAEEMVGGLEALARQHAAPAPPLETIAMADAAAGRSMLERSSVDGAETRT
jgi:hypothetical protein